MPQARIRTRTSFGPTRGRSASTTSALPGPVTIEIFMACLPVRCRTCRDIRRRSVRVALPTSRTGPGCRRSARTGPGDARRANYACALRFGGERVTGPVVDAAHDIHWVAHHFVVVHVEEAVGPDAFPGPQRPLDVIPHLPHGVAPHGR